MFGYTAFSRGQLDRINDLVAEAEANDDKIIGLVVNNPAGQSVSVSLIDESGEAVIEETFLGFTESDPGVRTSPLLAA